MSTLYNFFAGAHINPAISVSMMVSRKITPFRGMLFVAAQSGGAIAGAALLYGLVQIFLKTYSKISIYRNISRTRINSLISMNLRLHTIPVI